MIAFLRRLFARGAPVLSEVSVRDAPAIAGLHGASFHRGWSDGEIERMLIERDVLGHRAMSGHSLAGFILSDRVLEEAEILSVATYFCRSAKMRIDHHFAGTAQNADRAGYELTQELLAGRHADLRKGIV